MGSVTVLSAAKTLALLGETIVSAVIQGDNLILTKRNGSTLNLGNVRGASANNPTAAATAFSPASGIAATNVQNALVELAGDATTLSTNKADKTAVPKVLSGRAVQPSTANQQITKAYSNVFPAGFFAAAPEVVLMVNTTVPQNILYYSTTGITTRSFSIVSCRTTGADTNYDWIAVG